MIYCLSENKYPDKEHLVEEIVLKDQNDFEWRIARVNNGFFVKYFGEPYFKETYFSCDLKSGEHILIKNTNCIFIQDFENLTVVKYTIATEYTDDIWESFRQLFKERLEHDKGLIESEIVLTDNIKNKPKNTKNDIVSGFLDTRQNNEDFALTPYLFLVCVNKSLKVFGIGICWGYYSFYIGIGINIPKNYPRFKVIKNNNKTHGTTEI